MTDEADEATRKVRELASEVERLKQCLAEVMLDNQIVDAGAKVALPRSWCNGKVRPVQNSDRRFGQGFLARYP
jgi:hypothetical protein